MNKFARYTRRLILWFERPLRSEEKQIIWDHACAWQYNRIVKELGPIMNVQPYQTSKIPAKLPPLSARQRATMRKLRAKLVPIPERESTPPAVLQIEYDPRWIRPAFPPFTPIALQDESWLNSELVEIEDVGPPTDEVPSIFKLLHGGNKS